MMAARVIRSDRESWAEAQAQLNATPLEAARRIIRMAADRRYPEHAGFWDGPHWTLVRIDRRIVSGPRVHFERHDLALATRMPGDAFVTVYSIRSGGNVGIRPRAAVRIDGRAW